VLPDDAAGSYDYSRDPQLAEALMNSKEAKTISEVAAALRAEIIAGQYAGGKVPSRNKIGARFGISAESGGVVLRMLAAEGLIRMEQGRGTFAEPVQPHRAVVTVRRRDSAAPTSAWAAGIAGQLDGLGEADVSCPAVVAAGTEADIAVTVTARDAGYAAGRASAVVRELLGGDWEITGASVTARPA
jgi:DNA-binding transcriptional regulator YhcF (GntR family)